MKPINNRYHIIRPLGEGAMGTVLLADDAMLNRRVAVKTIRPEVVSRTAVKNFKREFQAMTRLTHPHLVRVFDFGHYHSLAWGPTKEPGYFLTMEFVDGPTLGQWANQQFDRAVDQVLPLFVDLLRAVEFIHSRGILHRDIKPDNVLVDQTASTDLPTVKLMDFGLADLEKSDKVATKGTLTYFAPEVIKRKADERSDIFALGVTFFHMLSDDALYHNSHQSIYTILRDPTVFERAHQVALNQLKNDSLRAVLKKMMAYDPADRYGSCTEIIADLNDQLDRSDAVETAATRQAYVLGASFVGRDAEFARLTGWLEATDRPQALCVYGEAGIGKSRLFREFQYHCQLQYLSFFQGDCVEVSQPNFGAFRTIVSECLLLASSKELARYGGELKKLLPDHPRLQKIDPAPRLDPRTERSQMIQHITHFILDVAKRQSSPPLVLYVNDLHWADEVSVQILEELLYQLNEGQTSEENPVDAVRIFLSCRPEGLDKLTRINERGRLERLELKPFDEQNVRSYFAAIFGPNKVDFSLHSAIPAINQKVGGNPFFLQELTKTLVEANLIVRRPFSWHLTDVIDRADVPTNLTALIAARVGRLTLSQSEARALLILALLHHAPTIEELSQITDVDRSFWDRLQDQELLTSEVSGQRVVWRTAHDLLRAAIVDAESSVIEMAVMSLAELHRQIADGLEALYADDLTPIIQSLAHHYAAADHREKAALYLEKAGDQAKASFQNERAFGFFDQLLTYDLDDAQRAAVLNKKGAMYATTGKWQEAENDFQKARELAEKTGNKVLQAQISNDLGILFQNSGKFDQALELHHTARTIFAEVDDKPEIINALCNIGSALYRQGDYSQAKEHLEQALEMNALIDDDASIGQAYGNFGLIYQVEGHYDRALECFQQQVSLAEKRGNKHNVCFAFANMGETYRYMGNYAQAMEYYERSLKIAIETGAKRAQAANLSNMGLIYLNQGNYARSIEYFQRLYHSAEEMGDLPGAGIARGNMGFAHFFRSHYDKALACFEEAEKIHRDIGFQHGLTYWLKGEADVHFQRKAFEKAHSLVKKCIELSTQLAKPDTKFTGSVLLTNIDFALGHRQKAISDLWKLAEATNEKEYLADIFYQLAALNTNIAKIDDGLAMDSDAYSALIREICQRSIEDYRTEALELNREIYRNTTKIQFKKRVDELIEMVQQSDPRQTDSENQSPDLGDALDSFV